MRYPDEPHEIVLGVPILVTAIAMVSELRESGHTVELNEDGNLVVTPLDDLHPDVLYTLEGFSEDIALLLQLRESTIH